MQKPIIHSNGDSAETLARAYQEARHALSIAAHALAETNPNPRNFYPDSDPDAWKKARLEHHERLAALEKIRLEMEQLEIHCQDIADEKWKVERQQSLLPTPCPHPDKDVYIGFEEAENIEFFEAE